MDMNAQKAETAQIFREIAQMEDMPAEAQVNFQFVADDARANWDAFTTDAEAAGYAVEWYEEEDEESEPYMEITTDVIALTVDALWAHEEKLTLMGALHGFVPDGWSFFGEGEGFEEE